MIFDSLGRAVATPKNEQLKKEKYEDVWKPEKDIPNGYYFIALKINDLQVHYEKVQRLK
ncbi:hypothetical protein OAB01_01765 [Bacteroidia bacterium]|nr:hypothetical protein [Bacteroidia bacterium]